MTHRRHVLVLAAAAACMPFARATDAPRIGFVIMHGKSGSPERNVNELAGALAARGFQVANLAMPWGGNGAYDASVADTERQVDGAIRSLRDQGAQKIFVAGHSQGGVFALHYGATHPVDGLVLMAPGGSVSTPVFREKLGDSLAEARKLVADGKGNETARLLDFEGARGLFPVVVRPAFYVEWFDPAGAMSQSASSKRLSASTPVLYISPTNDHPGLRKAKQASFDALPPNPLTRLIEPSSDHGGAPTAARKEIGDWAVEVAAAR